MKKGLFEMKQDRAFALAKAENLLKAADSANREMTAQETQEYEMAVNAVNALTPQIARIEKQNTLMQHVVNGKIIPAAGHLRQARTPGAPVVLSESYHDDFYTWIGSRGQQVGASLYEGSGPAGGYTVPVLVDGSVVPLAPNEMGVRSVATVVPTASDIKIPFATAFGTVDAKAESGAETHSFGEVDPTVDQFTLSAFMAGGLRTISWELSQDVPSFQQFCVRDLVLAVQMFEEAKYVLGSGTGEAQGLIGNTGVGVTDVAAGTDGYGSELLDATFDVMSTLNGAYHTNASWLMSRATGVAIRKAQKQANLFAPIWTREGGEDFLHGYRVTFSASMPAISAGNTPVLFGDFKAGYVIGDRGGSGINIKILDQVKAIEGQLVLLGYRRTDGRVRCSEAIQAITLANESGS
jgi:HK97 family phage major capsid protein